MSGLYLIIWSKKFDTLLQPTKGGYPHITVAHTGKNLTVDQLKQEAKTLIDIFVMNEIVLVKAHVNSFILDERNTPNVSWRHDVLVTIAENKSIEVFREYLREQYTDIVDKFNMRDIHVTLKTCDTREEAYEFCATVNDKLLPRVVTITGITIA